jgi:hypothetical protein
MTVTFFDVASETELNAAIASIDVGGVNAATNTAYQISITSDLTLGASLTAINLGSGDSLTLQGANPDNDNLVAQIDGGGTYQGFVVDAGTVTLSNLALTALSAPGGAGGAPGGGGALYVGAGATVSTTAVTLSGDSAHGGTPAGGAVFVAEGGALDLSGGSLAGASVSQGLFIQGDDTVTLNGSNVTGVIADQTGAHLGVGAGALVIQGAVTLSANNLFVGGTTIEGALTLLAPGAAGAGPISFSALTGETLTLGAGDAPANQIDGFAPGPGTAFPQTDTIDLMGIGAPSGYVLSSGNRLTVTGALGSATLQLDPGHSYVGDSFVLAADAGVDAAAGALVSVLRTTFSVSNEAQLNAAIAAIDVSGGASVGGMAYAIDLAASFSLTGDIDAINLAPGASLTIDGGGHTIDGAGAHRGFLDYSGALTLENLTIQNAVATGGAGGSGATPGGGGAGLGGGLFVASQGAATLSNVTFLNDSAVGGAAGPTGAGVGGGGGLGGQGGAGGVRNGGGGGVGASASGGVYGASAGGAGIIIGAASGLGGTGNRPAGGAGGADGGGGGAAGTIVTSGSGRGGGGSRTYAGVAGSGGVAGGFGGGAGGNHAAGFGGGGSGGAGGFGGGGSGGTAGGFGGGGGGLAGGGLGAGGAIFVQQGGALTIAGGSVSGGMVSGGLGAGGGGQGSALGSGIFVQGTGALVFAPTSGQTLTLSDAIADQGGPGGGGAASVWMAGAGALVLGAANSFSGGLTIQSGQVSLRAPGAAGSGPITFTYGSSALLTTGPGDLPANVISGLLPGDSLHLEGVGAATSAVLGAGDKLLITGGGANVTLSLDPAQNFTGESFVATPDGAGGTTITAVTLGGDHPPSISGAGLTLQGTDEAALNPLGGVVIADLDPGQTESATVTLSAPTNGTLSNLAGGVYDPASGVYTVSGSAAAVTAALDGLTFTPVAHQVAPGQSVPTDFHLSVTDGVMIAAASNSLVATAVNDPPVITGAGVWVTGGYFTVPLTPFAGVTVTDPDVGAVETVTLTVANAGFPSATTPINGTLALPAAIPGVSLTQTGPGTYALSAASPAAVTQAIDALTFTPVSRPDVPGFTLTSIGLSVSDGTTTTTASNTIEAGAPVIAGAAAGQTTLDTHPLEPFSQVVLTDTPGVASLSVTIQVTDAGGLATDANGLLSGAGLSHVGVGLYTLAADTPANISAALEAVTFTPTPHQALPGQSVTTDFVIEVSDGATTSDNGDTSVIAQATAVAPYDFNDDGVSDFLIENAGGTMVTGEFAAGQLTYTQVAAVGPEWTFHGAGDFFGDGRAGFLMENRVGAVVVGEVASGAASFTQVAALGSEWSFKGDGDFLADGKTDFLIENTAGVLVVGETGAGAQASFTQIGGLGPDWTVVGTGDFLGEGHDQFLIENTAGAVVVGDVTAGQAVYSQVAGLGPEWRFVGAGDFLGPGKTDFLIENSAGAVVVGEVGPAGQASFTQVAGLGAEWKFVGAGDYLGEGHDQFLIQDSAGAVVAGDYLNGQIHYTQLASLGSEWVFH